MKHTTLSISCLLAFYLCIGQIVELKEKEPYTLNGLEYGYIIKNEQLKSVSKEEYSRFEITLYASNKSGCTKLFAEKTSANTDNNVIANFSCVNANGKRLTSKSGSLNIQGFYVTIKLADKDTKVKAGYSFRNGETIKNNIILLVPKGTRPEVQLTTNYLVELQ